MEKSGATHQSQERRVLMIVWNPFRRQRMQVAGVERYDDQLQKLILGQDLLSIRWSVQRNVNAVLAHLREGVFVLTEE